MLLEVQLQQSRETRDMVDWLPIYNSRIKTKQFKEVGLTRSVCFLIAGSINLAGSLCALVSFLIFNRKHKPLQSDQDPPDTNCMELIDTKERTNSVIVS